VDASLLMKLANDGHGTRGHRLDAFAAVAVRE